MRSEKAAKRAIDFGVVNQGGVLAAHFDVLLGWDFILLERNNFIVAAEDRDKLGRVAQRPRYILNKGAAASRKIAVRIQNAAREVARLSQ